MRYLFLLSFFYIALSEHALASSLSFSPSVSLNQRNSNYLSLNYLQPCGGKFHSILLQEIDEEIRFAVVLQQEATVCTALPAVRTVSLANLDIPAQKKIGFISPFLGKGRLQIAPSQEIKESNLYFQAACSEFLGLLVQADLGAANLKLGALQYVEKSGGDQVCARKLEFTSLDLLKRYSPKKIALLNPVIRKKTVTSLELLPVKFQAQSRQEISVATEIDCTQQLVGVAVRANSAGALSVGALVVRKAEDSRMTKCDRRSQLSVVNLAGLGAIHGKRLMSIASASTLNNWQISSPMLRYESRFGLTIAQAQDDRCGKGAALDFQVYGIDHFGSLAIGVLTRDDRAYCYEINTDLKVYGRTLFKRLDQNISVAPMQLVF